MSSMGSMSASSLRRARRTAVSWSSQRPVRNFSTAAARFTVGATLPSGQAHVGDRAVGLRTTARRPRPPCEIACAARVPTLRNNCTRRPRRGEGDLIASISSPGAERRLLHAGEMRGTGPAARPRAAAIVDHGVVDGERRERVARPGEALAMLPPRVPRFWIWMPPMVAQAVGQQRQRGGPARRGSAGASCVRRAPMRSSRRRDLQRCCDHSLDAPTGRALRGRASSPAVPQRPSGRCRRQSAASQAARRTRQSPAPLWLAATR